MVFYGGVINALLIHPALNTPRQMCDVLREHLLSVLLQSGMGASVFKKQESFRRVGASVTLMRAETPSLLAIFILQISKSLWSTREAIALDSNFLDFQIQISLICSFIGYSVHSANIMELLMREMMRSKALPLLQWS